ncbi:hypothetical protein HanPI659440_Chr17g0687001 [Helianthus annuus]|uniref:Uncharacterized protein n=1 Tax=Helianthus annuus TaxID=4232 RepID=A0A9K3GUY5_HELAN|nr:hypothetical protein HanXRQr2_Chr17g0811001 [Helianthus annuus]KAJ0429684.1 hypothetical protein HanHA300_Chr17g0660241 [Helianthus annuus]KAJ0434310.1 hypothetical protein HanIR_Chr17g0880111 [Helianthus annuus]KAJ0448125.1 hypothetical protein HanHA89_Chr17g0713201 [Helianthus annuus]KAJ0633009.1 hypothetical protein HanLR1_Chr17g0671681 [Helianthus annuus]
MATPVATVAPESRFNDDDDLFRSESIGIVVELELFMYGLYIRGGICLHMNFRLTVPRNAGMQNSCFHFRC